MQRPVVCLDFEFNDEEVHCLVAQDFATGRLRRWWAHELAEVAQCPLSRDAFLVAHYASAEAGCFVRLGWDPSEYDWIDTYAEFRCLTNDDGAGPRAGLLNVLAYLGLTGLGDVEKEEMRDLALRGGPFSRSERSALLAYCESDVHALTRIWKRLAPHIDFPRAILRGRYMVACARMERRGIPIDAKGWERLQSHWNPLRERLIQEVNAEYGVYEGSSFRVARFIAYLRKRGIQWPVHPSGSPKLDDETFREITRRHPQLRALHQLRATLGQMRSPKLEVASDGRARCLLSAFRSKTSRNQPSNARFPFGLSSWFRALIKPEPGTALAYIDWSQQEFGIAAALSGDETMKAAYLSGDPYLAFAKQAKTVPADATKQSHPDQRAVFKACTLAVQYGQGAVSFATQIGVPLLRARRLLELHRETYPDFWRWSDRVVAYAMLERQLHTTFGWYMRVGAGAREPLLRNFLMQANGAEMLRLACCFATERQIRVCAPVHDAVLIEAPIDDIETEVLRMQAEMARASRIVLEGFELKSDVETVRHPDRYIPEKGADMWTRVQGLLQELSHEA